MWPRDSNGTAGFTLVEVLVSMTLMLMLGAAALTGVTALARGSHSLGNYSAMNAEGRLVIEQLGQDIRQMDTITTATTTSLAGSMLATSGTGTQDVSYTYNANAKTLSRSVGGNVVRTYRDITSLTFLYYNAQGAATTTISQFKQIQLRAVTTMAVGGAANTTGRILTAQFTVRSL